MATLNAVIVASKALKDGRNKVRISLAHNGETRYIVTNIILNSNSEFKNGVVVRRPDANMLNIKIRNLLQRYQEALDELNYVNGLTCPEVMYLLMNAGKDKHRTLTSICEEYISLLDSKESTKVAYLKTWRVIERFLGSAFLIEHLTHVSILSLDKYLRDRKLSRTTIRRYMAFLKIICKYGERCGYVDFRSDPFLGYKMPLADVRQCWLSVNEIKRIRDLKTPLKHLIKCRDLFMLSYYLGGINMADLLKINFKKNPGQIHYIRQKTENINSTPVEFEIPDEAKELLSRYLDSDGFLKVSASDRKDKCHHFFCYNMWRLAEATGIKKIIYYSARKSFAQHAFDIGVNTAVIDYILGHKVHGGGTSLYSYISVTPEMATEAVRKVLDNLK